MRDWALDLGTTNSKVSYWDRAEGRPKLLELPRICRRPVGDDVLEVPRVVPSAVWLSPGDGFATRMGARPFFAKRTFWGQQGLIGVPALERADAHRSPNFVSTFKEALLRAPLKSLTRIAAGAGGSKGSRDFSGRDVARIFVRELLAEVKRETGQRIRQLTVTVPVESFERYRAEVGAIGQALGVHKLTFIDEPVAAALGYGLGLRARRNVLVVDAGGGTLDLALVELSPRDVRAGHCKVLGKAGRPLGGNLVDHWLLEEICERLELPLGGDEDDDTLLWQRALLFEARRIKESLHFRDVETFVLPEIDELRVARARLYGRGTALEVSKQELIAVLEQRGFYEELHRCLDEVLEQAGTKDAGIVDDVLMVGGSSLLPGVYSVFEERLGRDRVRAWQPFEAVTLGAATFSAGQVEQTDFIVHDYAFVTHDATTREPQYNVVVNAGTRFPSPEALWKRQVVPTCSHGAAESVFKLVICEIGRSHAERRFAFDRSGATHKLGGRQGTGLTQLVVPLNETDPVLGNLQPPHEPSDRRPRLEISFQINASRWLCATVVDLHSKRAIMTAQPVVRLL